MYIAMSQNHHDRPDTPPHRTCHLKTLHSLLSIVLLVILKFNCLILSFLDTSYTLLLPYLAPVVDACVLDILEARLLTLLVCIMFGPGLG